MAPLLSPPLLLTKHTPQLAAGGPDLRSLANDAGQKPWDLLPPLRPGGLLHHLLHDRVSLFVTQQLLARVQLAGERGEPGAGGGGGGSGHGGGHALSEWRCGLLRGGGGVQVEGWGKARESCAE